MHTVETALLPGQSKRFKQQIEFLLEVDKLKGVDRQTILLDGSRRENSAEHSWHIVLSVLLFSEYAHQNDIDLFRVMKMLVIHDLVEVYAGDTYCYDDQKRQHQAEREMEAAEKIFNLLPADQAGLMRSLWDEFEARQTAESRFANALDRFQPFLHNYFTRGQTWRANHVRRRQVEMRMKPVRDGSQTLWQYVITLLDDAVRKEFLMD
jgi:putative hydrolase of HD superfamily